MSFNILLVDDDKEFREEFCDLFQDYEIIEAPNGEEALRLLKKPNEIDLVILDEVMSGLRGTQVLKAIKKIAPDLGIIILTGYSSKDVAVEALKGRADDYIEKPINLSKTREIIERVLSFRKTKTGAYPDSIKGKIERVKYFLERNYHKKVLLTDAAELVFLSPKYLSRIFRQDTGMRFSEYKLRIKTKKAKELLKKTHYNIDQISDKLGYQNTESFIRIFKGLTDTTPTRYRNKTKRKKR